MRRRIALVLGFTLIASGLIGASITFGPSSASARESAGGATREQMHEQMDSMMGAGFSERMHAAMPGSEEMMDACANTMPGMMDGMTPAGGSMMNMMDGMMGER